ncbi:hypothetical protein [Rhodobacter lacus]|uniref:Holin n=1 Tax=Rhodobacter lacus TaxID=1641972 RepID=A0ABW5ABG8_9RHOB
MMHTRFLRLLDSRVVDTITDYRATAVALVSGWGARVFDAGMIIQWSTAVIAVATAITWVLRAYREWIGARLDTKKLNGEDEDDEAR